MRHPHACLQIANAWHELRTKANARADIWSAYIAGANGWPPVRALPDTLSAAWVCGAWLSRKLPGRA